MNWFSYAILNAIVFPFVIEKSRNGQIYIFQAIINKKYESAIQ